MTDGLAAPTPLMTAYGVAKRRGDSELDKVERKILHALVTESALETRNRMCMDNPQDTTFIRSQFDPLIEILQGTDHVGQTLDTLKTAALKESKGVILYGLGAASAPWWLASVVAAVAGIYAGVNGVGEAVGSVLIIAALVSVTATLMAIRAISTNAEAIGRSAGQFLNALGGLWRYADRIGRPAQKVFDQAVTPAAQSMFPGGAAPRPGAADEARTWGKGLALVVYVIALAGATIFVVGLGKGMSAGMEDACDAGTVDPRYRGSICYQPVPPGGLQLTPSP